MILNIKQRNVCLKIIIIVLFLSGCTCNNNSKQAEFANIKLQIEHGAYEKIILEQVTSDNIVKKDSVILDQNGVGWMRLIPEETEIMLLRFYNNDFIPLVIDKNNIINVTADRNNIRNTFVIEGNNESNELNDYFHRLFHDMNVSDSLGELLRMYKETPAFIAAQNRVMSQYDMLYAEHKAFASNLIITYPDNLANLLIINQRIGNQRIFNMQQDTAIYFLIDKNLYNSFPQNSHVLKFHDAVVAYKQEIAVKQIAAQRLLSGNKAPDFTISDISGKLVSLSDFQGKIILLFFWASWEKGTPNNLDMLKTMYEDYKNDGVEFIAVSMDKDEAAWKNAVKQQKTNWVNLSDLKSSSSSLIQLYNLPEKLPVYYLIGADGMILAQHPSMMEIDDIIYYKISHPQ